MKLGFMNLMTTQNILDDIEFAIKNDFTAFEIDLDWEQNWNLKARTIKEIKNQSRANDITLEVHTAWFLPTSTIISSVQKSVVKVIKNGIILAKKIGSDRVTVHPGYTEVPKVIREKNYNALIKTLKEIVKIADNYGIMVGLENHAIPNHPCFYVEDLLKVVNSVENLRVTLDVGHINITGTLLVEYYKRVKDFVIDMHAHDNDGSSDQHKCIGDGNINFKPLLKELKKNGYEDPFIMEMFPYDNILKGRKRFLKLWNSV